MKFNHTAHKALWNWLAENPDKNKEDWPEWEENGGERPRILCGCFACESVARKGCDSGSRCPLEWPIHNNMGFTSCIYGGLFEQWGDAIISSPAQLRSDLARQIANLPVKPGVECE